MKRVLKWTLGIIVLAIAIIATMFTLLPREPKYEGRPLSQWIADLNDPKKQLEAEKAIRSIGPKAVPFLKNSLEQRRSTAVRIYRSNAMAQKWLRGFRERFKWHAPVMESRNAAIALGKLGPQGEAAAPNLIAALSDDSPLVSQSAAIALGQMGPAVAPLLADRLRYAPTNDTAWALRAIRFLGTNGTSAARATARVVPVQGIIGDEAALSLGAMGPAAVPEITSLLQDTNTTIRTRAAVALTQMGPRAVSATNALLQTLNDPDPQVRSFAMRALFSARAPNEITRPAWIKGFHDPVPANVVVAIQSFSFDPAGVSAYSNEVTALLLHPDKTVRSAASNLLIFLSPEKK